MGSWKKLKVLLYMVLMVASLYALNDYRSQYSYEIRYSQDRVPGWRDRSFDDGMWLPVSSYTENLEGYFRIHMDKLPAGGVFRIIKVDDCLSKAYFDGRMIFNSSCGSCTHCAGLDLNLSGGEDDGGHVLALHVMNTGGGEGRLNLAGESPPVIFLMLAVLASSVLLLFRAVLEDYGHVLEGMAPHAILVLSLLLLLLSSFMIFQNAREFKVVGSFYSSYEGGGWYQPWYGLRGFREVDLPFFRGGGFNVVKFTSSAEEVEIDIVSDLNVEKVYLDGELEFDNGASRVQYTSGYRLRANLGDEEIHTLAVRTRGRGGGYFFVEHGLNAFEWRVTALLSLIVLCYYSYVCVRGRDFSESLRGLCRIVHENRMILAVVIFAMMIRVVIMPTFLNIDVKDMELYYTENLIHKTDLHLTLLDPDYNFNGNLYLTKPPGWAMYPLGIIRVLFGFNSLYLPYLIKLPAVLGDLLVAYGIWSILRGRGKSKTLALLAVSLYLFNPEVLRIGASEGKTDALGLGLILLALKNIEHSRFSLYYGYALVHKQFALLLLPWLILQKRLYKRTFMALLLAFLLMLPFLVDDPLLVYERLIGPNLDRPPAGMSWMTKLEGWGFEDYVTIRNLMFRSYFALIVLTSLFIRLDRYTMGALVFTLFLVSTHVIHEQYLLWCMPFLILAFFLNNRYSALMPLLVVGYWQINHELNIWHSWVLYFPLACLVFAADVLISNRHNTLIPEYRGYFDKIMNYLRK
ncbi:MAG: hypothetical protein GF416_05410 [Candidatus Altiarchaeales archaeon]|nr:hypothetical protein [Candidatus Altiarchaeales archaeon]MBD3416555.1 hypothetical protein [Candidatus Altiarchaeales archaeon]